MDLDGKPLRNVSVRSGAIESLTDAEGPSRSGRRPDAAVLVKLPGYREDVRRARPGSPVEVVLKPQAVKAAYLTYYGVGDRGIRGRVLGPRRPHRAERGGDRRQGRPRLDPLPDRGARGAGRRRPGAGHMQGLRRAAWPTSRRRGIYTIARIVTFKDNILANARPDLAIIDTRTGKPWIDNEKLAWVDPFREEVWDYNIAIGQEAVRRGFDEVQFDYVRFPTDGKLRRREVRQAQHPGDAAARHRRLPGQGAHASSAPSGRLRRPPTCSATPRSTRTTPTSASASRSWRRTSTTSARWSTRPATTRASRAIRNPMLGPVQGGPRERAADPQARGRQRRARSGRGCRTSRTTPSTSASSA